MGETEKDLVSGIILCGGLSQRMAPPPLGLKAPKGPLSRPTWEFRGGTGEKLPLAASSPRGGGVDRGKAWLDWEGEPLLCHVVRRIQPLVKEVVVVARPGQEVPNVSARVLTDRIPGVGPLGGLEAGLAAIKTPYGIVVACDMPWLNLTLLKAMVPLIEGYELVIPQWQGRLQPLHAIYAKCLEPLIRSLVAQGERQMVALIHHVKARVLDESLLRTYDPEGQSLSGVDTWEVYQALIHPVTPRTPRPLAGEEWEASSPSSGKEALPFRAGSNGVHQRSSLEPPHASLDSHRTI